jgi:hypothetical protein
LKLNTGLEDMIRNSHDSEDIIIVKHELECCGFNKEFINTCVSGIKTRELLQKIIKGLR